MSRTKAEKAFRRAGQSMDQCGLCWIESEPQPTYTRPCGCIGCRRCAAVGAPREHEPDCRKKHAADAAKEHGR